MTKLRNDGYLETDDPVVAACFLRKNIEADNVHHIPGAGYLNEVHSTAVVVGWTRCLYPILIPAQTVAEMCYDDDGVSETREFSIVAMYLDYPNPELDDWISEHTEATP